MMLDRRNLMTMLGAGAMAAVARPARAVQMSSPVTAYAFSFKALDGGDILLASHAGKPLLVVNTASLCGYTPQYAGLQEIWTRYRARGLVVLGVPSNDFGSQEPGGTTDIQATAQKEYHVTFPLTEKVTVKGPNAHPFYKWAAQLRPQDAPRWNFHKYLVGRDGGLVAGYASAVEPTEPRIVAAIERELGE